MIYSAIWGGYVTFVDSDDYVTPDYLGCFTFDSDVCVVDSVEHVEWEGLPSSQFKTVTPSVVRGEKQSRECWDSYFNCFRAPWAKLFRSDIIKKYHLRFNEQMRLAEDTLFCIEYMQYCHSVAFCTVPQGGYHYSGGERSTVYKRYGCSPEDYADIVKWLYEAFERLGIEGICFHESLTWYYELVNAWVKEFGREKRKGWYVDKGVHKIMHKAMRYWTWRHRIIYCSFEYLPWTTAWGVCKVVNAYCRRFARA